jgi:CHASE2 domain-containing sensor protein
LGFLDVGYPQFWWVIAALGIVTVLTVQGLGILLPMNLKLYFEIMKSDPDHDKLKRWMRTYVRVVAMQGTMQVLIIVVMARFATGF